MRKVERILMRAVHRSSRQLHSSQARLAALSFVRAPDALSTLSSLPTPLDQLRASTQALPSFEELPTAPAGYQRIAPGGGKRQWEVGREGYERWAMSQLMGKARAGAGDKAGVTGMVKKAEEIVITGSDAQTCTTSKFYVVVSADHSSSYSIKADTKGTEHLAFGEDNPVTGDLYPNQPINEEFVIPFDTIEKFTLNLATTSNVDIHLINCRFQSD